jgi:hypothetical protein
MNRSFAETSRAMKIAFFCSSLLGLIVGLATGVPEGKALAVRLFALRTGAIERELAEFSAMQFKHADAEHAREAVLSEIRTLEGLQHLALQAAPIQTPQKNPSQWLYIAYARLAMIEEAAGHAAEAKAALAKAVEQWRVLHPGTDATFEQLKHAVRDFDSQTAGAGH